MRIQIGLAVALLVSIKTANAAAITPACGDLAGFAPSGTHVVAAAMVAVSPAWSPDPKTPKFAVSVPFCRVQGVIGRQIGFELWLPQKSAWNGRYLGTGVGGDAGVYNFRDLPRGVAQGYAAATTDTGHKASNGTWMLNTPASLVDFELRAQHLLAQTAETLVRIYYGHSAAHDYFLGCSGGGRQALKELQRFPQDYDGIIAGAPGPNTSEMTARRMWELQLRDHNVGLMSAADWKFVADAAVAACDGQDGVVDGVINDPRQCHFDASSLACPAKGRCLSAAQLALVNEIYDPLRDENGQVLDQGLLPGVLVDSGRSKLAPAIFGQVVHGQADWNGADFKVGADLASMNRLMPELSADDPDIRPFATRGGKLIIYQGWSDPAVAARMVVGYYQAVLNKLGPASAKQSVRLFMAPGVGHCGGGAGPDLFGGAGAAAPVIDADHDLLSALDTWVSKGQAPNRIIASKIKDNRIVETRPLCAFPASARYEGGNPNSATNFRCVAP